MDYNTQREKLTLPVYGRIVQNMVDYTVSLPDKAERQRCAEQIIAIMAQMSPKNHQSSDFEQTLWDHLALMSNYKLDIDWPFEVERTDELKRPDPLPYPMNKIRYRHYGHILEQLLQELKKMEPGERRDRLTQLLANQMHKDLFYWNRNALSGKKITDDVSSMTDGVIRLTDEQVHFAPVVQNNKRPAGRSTGRRSSKNR